MADLKKRFEKIKQSRFWAIFKKVFVGLSFVFNAVILLLLLVGLSSCGVRPVFASDSSLADSSLEPSPGGTLNLRYDMGNAGLNASVSLPVGTNSQIGGATYLTYDSTTAKVGYRYTPYTSTDPIPSPTWQSSDLGLLIWNIRSVNSSAIGLNNMPYCSFVFVPYTEYYNVTLLSLKPTAFNNPAYEGVDYPVYSWWLGSCQFSIGSTFGTSPVSPIKDYTGYPSAVSFTPSVVSVAGSDASDIRVSGVTQGIRFHDEATASVYLSALYVDLVVTPSAESAIEDYYNLGFNTGRNEGYTIGYSEGYESGVASGSPVTTFSSLLSNSFDSISSILNLDLFGLTLGTWLFIPVTVGLIFLVLRLFNHG